MHLEMHLRGAHGSRENKGDADKAETYDHPSICGRDQVSVFWCDTSVWGVAAGSGE